MRFKPGDRVSTYEVLGPLGAGAMGEVFRAKDTRLGREVAIKLLPDHLAESADHLARFAREAKLLATLNHPHVAGIFAVENEADADFIVMEFVPGATLGERIAAGPLRLRDALRLARQVADGLEAAHEAGVVHRDLKPDNIRVTPDDTVKLLDFGLAKAAGGEGSESLDLTRSGVLLGTPYYMSPEQVRGRPVDRRADIWAFGCVLYEMLAGARAFPGETLAEVAAAVIEKDPDWDGLPADVPPRVRELLAACLTRDPKDRLRDVGDARRELDAALAGRPAPAEPAVVATAPRLPWAVAAAGVLAAAVALGVLASRSEPAAKPAPAPVAEVRFQVPIPEDRELTGIALSPDGSAVALELWDAEAGAFRLAVRRLDEIGVRELPITASAFLPFWSPDGTELGFVSGGKIRACALATVAVREICDCPGARGAPAWGPNGVILFTPRYDESLWRVSDRGGEPERATRLEAGRERSHRQPHFAPDGVSFTYQVIHLAHRDGERPKPAELYLARPGRERVPLVASEFRGAFAGGCLIWRQGPRVMGRPFDIDAAAFTGDAFPVATGVQRDNLLSVSPAGVVAFQDGAAPRVGNRLRWVDREGNELETVGEPDWYYDPRVGPDGRIVAEIRDYARMAQDLWIIHPRGETTPFTIGRNGGCPVWSPDGSRIAYHVNRDGKHVIVTRLSDGTGEPEVIAPGICPEDWSSDGRWLAFSHHESEAEDWIRMHSLDGETPLDLKEIGSRHVRFSPDVRWIAYEALGHIYLRRFPELTNRVPVCAGSAPIWMPGGGLLFHSADGRASFVELTEREGALHASEPRPLFESRVVRFNTTYDVAPDGKRILVNTKPEPNRTPVTVITGWRPP